MDVAAVLKGVGGIASTSTLARRGVTARHLASALNGGVCFQPRRGWYAIASAPPEVVAAVRLGGSLACVSALRLQGVWTFSESTMHVRVSRGVALGDGHRHRVHWTDDRATGSFPMDSVPIALASLIACRDRVAAVAALDSAIHLRHISRTQAIDICSQTARGRALVVHIDGKAESGLETIARLALRARRVPLRSQVRIGDVARVDLMIGDRLVLELDGESWHDRPGDFERDRARDRALITSGYIVLRASYRQVMTEWQAIEEQVMLLVRRGDHRWPAKLRRV